MKVLHVINGLGTGGAERSLAELVPHLRGHGIEPTIACLFRRAQGVEQAVLAKGIDVRFLPPAGRLAQVHALQNMVREVAPDVVHTSIFEADVIGRLAAGRSMPVLTSLVNTSYGTERSADPRLSLFKLRGVQLVDALTGHLLTTQFHAVTQAVKDAAVRGLRLAPARITVVPRGRDRARLGEPGAERRREVRARLGLADDIPVLVHVGRHEYQKGQGHLLDAASIVARAQPEAVWLMAGREGTVTAALAHQHNRSELGDRVRFLGHRDDVPDLLAAADVFVFPSVYEGLGGAIIEAMALGVPVVASDLPALREVTGNGASAVLVPPCRPGALATAVLELLADPERRAALDAAGRRRFEQYYTLERAVGGMVALFRATAVQGRSR